MKFLVDECLHTSLIEIVARHGHLGYHVTWLGLSGASDRALMTRIRADDFTFVTNNASDFRKLFARADVHAGLVIIVPQVAPAKQRDLLTTLFATFPSAEDLVNEVIEIGLDDGEAVFTRYALPRV